MIESPLVNLQAKQAQARTVLGRTNRIRLGALRHGDYVTELLAQSHELPADVRQRVSSPRSRSSPPGIVG